MADRTQNRMKSNRYLVHMGAESGKRRAVSCLVCGEGKRIDKIEFVVVVLEHPLLTAILRTICDTGPRRRRMPRERVTLLRLGLGSFKETWRKDSIVGWYTETRGRITAWICAQPIRRKAGGEGICHGRARRCCFSEAQGPEEATSSPKARATQAVSTLGKKYG